MLREQAGMQTTIVTWEADMESNYICDKRFAIQLSEILKLKGFLFEEKVKLNPDEEHSIDLGRLNNLRLRNGFWNGSGRLPSEEEWKLLDEKLSVLTSHLSDDLRQKIRIRELIRYFYTIPIWFLFASISAVLYYFLYPSFILYASLPSTVSFLGSLVVWTVSQGGLGACAFLGTRMAMKVTKGAGPAESSEEEADLTDRNFLKTRILLGCLFAFIFGLPLSLNGLEGMRHFLFPSSAVLTSTSAGAAAAVDISGKASSSDITINTTDIVWIVAPFMIGFSIHLVLALLNRFITSMRTFFGITDK